MQLELEAMLLWVVHKARPLQGPERGWLRCRQRGRSGWLHAAVRNSVPYLTACCAGMQLHGISYQPYTNGSGCTEWTAQDRN